MRPVLVPAPRRLDFSLPVWIVGGTWAALVATAWTLDQLRGTATPTCLFRAATGIPCPTCGSTRCVARLAHADLAGAWLFNPFMTVAILTLAAWLVLRFGFGRQLSLGLSTRQTTLAWVAGFILLLLNWVYVLRSHGTI